MSTWEWVLVIVAGIAAPFVLMAVIGSLLPRRHTATRSVTLRQKPETVWHAVSNLERWPSWWMLLQSVERLPDRGRRPVYRQGFRGRRGPQFVDLEISESKPPHRLVTEVVDVRGPFQGRWTYEVAPADAGSRLTVTEEGAVGNPLVRFFFRTMMSKTYFIESYLKAIAQKFGETAELK